MSSPRSYLSIRDLPGNRPSNLFYGLSGVVPRSHVNPLQRTNSGVVSAVKRDVFIENQTDMLTSSAVPLRQSAGLLILTSVSVILQHM